MFVSYNAFANNISVSNFNLTGQNGASHSIMVKFDIAWENSWRTSSAPNNWDAAWVFVKYRVMGTSEWQHAWLNNTGHNAPSGSTIDVGLLDPALPFNATTNPGMGAFIYRNANGTGTFSKTDVQFRWNYGANGVSDVAMVEICVYAIEHVFVPQGSFYVGSGGAESGAFYKYPTTTNPYQITGEGAITVGTTADNLYYSISTNSGDQGGPIPAAFPKGYKAFYSMKYEISQQEYVDFLNSLTYTQQATRTIDVWQIHLPNSTAGTYLYDAYRNKIKISTSGTASTVPAIYATDYPYVACNYLCWSDVAAYLDWSGLRPMTELEYEKSCRGLLAPVPDEFAWGTAGIVSSQYTLSNSGANNEIIATGYSVTDGNASYAATVELIIVGPLRVGIFASNSSNRVTSGATYYGIMEMSGNVWEQIVSTGHATGRLFTGTNGNGVLNTSGNADAITWPPSTFPAIGSAPGAGFKGGYWDSYYDILFSTDTDLQVSGRMCAADPVGVRGFDTGGRGVRTAP
jgi:formylglycine-generating enzyme required for sulfatase activity